MTEHDLEQIISEMLLNESSGGGSLDGVRVENYDEAGVLTRDAGLVVKIDGKEFQLTIVRRLRKREVASAKF